MEKEQPRTALLIGATGLVGQCCLKFLLEDPVYQKINLITRRNLDIIHPKIQQQQIFFDNLENYSSLLFGQDIFCCLGTTLKKAGSQSAFRKVDFYYPSALAKIYQKKGARQFLLISSLEANSQSKIFYNRVKGEVEEAISSIPYRGIQIFRPSLLLGNRTEFRLGEKIGGYLLRIFKVALFGRFKKYRPISAETVAYSMVEIAKVDLKGVNIFESDQIQFFYQRLGRNI